MGTFSGLRNATRSALGRMVAARRQRQTARLIESLPPNILKDIGLSGDYVDVLNIRNR